MSELRQPVRPLMALEITARLERCPSCGVGVPLNGLLMGLACPNCTQPVQVPMEWWQEAIGKVPAAALLFTDGPQQLDKRQHFPPHAEGQEARPGLEVARRLVEGICCPRCQASLPWPGPHAQGPQPCPSCGAPDALVPAPPSLRGEEAHLARPAWIGAPEGTGSELPSRPEESKPVVMACPNCGGSLRIGVEHPRTTSCGFCDASVFIPDPLWRALHPVKVAVPWYVLLRLEPDAVRATWWSGLGDRLGGIIGFGVPAVFCTVASVIAWSEGKTSPALGTAIAAVILSLVLVAIAVPWLRVRRPLQDLAERLARGE